MICMRVKTVEKEKKCVDSFKDIGVGTIKEKSTITFLKGGLKLRV